MLCDMWFRVDIEHESDSLQRSANSLQSYRSLDANRNLNMLKSRITNTLQNYQIREKRLVARWKSLEFEVSTLKDIISQMRQSQFTPVSGSHKHVIEQ